MGAVYEAMDERLDAVVALKETLFADERLRKQFEREARLLARMHHPALPRVSDHFSEGDGQFLVMQFIEGDDLAQMMTLKRGHFPVEQVLTWGDQLLDALDYLHTQDPQIIHRDIKPQNLKLTARGQIILLDFGLAKGQSGEMSPTAVTSASIFGYTPNYAPLEQIQGLGTDARSDIYALSATLYHLMTYVKPPSALTRAAALVNGESDPLQPANEINGFVSPAVANVLAKAMSQNREQRFASAVAMRQALDAGLKEPGTIPLGSGLSTVTDPAVSTRRDDVATVLFERHAATMPIPGRDSHARPSSGTATRSAGETTVVRAPGSAGRRGAPWAIGAAALVVVAVVVGALYAYQNRGNSVERPAVSASPEATPTPDMAAAPATGSVAEEKKFEASKSQVPEETAKKKPSVERAPQKSTAEASENPSNTQDSLLTPPNRAGEAQIFQRPPPNINVPQTPEMRRHRDLPITGTTRSLPDGTQVVTQPDGTRVLIMPNGTTRIFRPGERIIPRRRRLP